MKPLTKPEFLAAAKKSSRICLFQEVASDYYTPIGIFKSLANHMQGATILESGIHHPQVGRYSYLGLDPVAQLVVKNKAIKITEHGQEKVISGGALDAARLYLKKFHCSHVHPLAKFIGGSTGFISYDAVRLFEAIPGRHQDDGQLPNLVFNFYRITITFDHEHQKLIIALAVDVADDAATAYDQAIHKIAKIMHIIAAPAINDATRLNKAQSAVMAEPDVSDADFVSLVEKAKHYIVAGDAFQIVLSRRFIKNINVSAFEIYRALRYRSPAPYMFYVDYGDTIIVGASPEKLVSVENGLVSITPIAGTRARGGDKTDGEISQELLTNEKEIAEHMMLVDLARNDIGAVCQPSSINVPELMQAKIFSHVIHLTSLVQGQLQEGCDALDLLKTSFPAGTLSGAPKIRAMEIIDELEHSRRGLYGGAIFYIDHQGNFDSCIAIRMAVIKDRQAVIRTGAGIVFDSDPLMEAEETRHKARSVLEAIQMAEEGIL